MAAAGFERGAWRLLFPTNDLRGEEENEDFFRGPPAHAVDARSPLMLTRFKSVRTPALIRNRGLCSMASEEGCRLDKAGTRITTWENRTLIADTCSKA